ncbi:MAG: flagellar motor switch phosphatase FliY [Desulfitobacteriia bacterium]
MSKGMLSQEEIDALLSESMNADYAGEKDTSLENNLIDITDLEKDAIGEIANISMGTAATTLSQIVGKRVEITTPKVDITSAQKIFDEYPIPHILIDVKYKSGIEGSNMLILSRRDGSIIVDLMMGGKGLNPTDDLSEMQISGISEAMNQMIGSAATSMSTVFNAVVDITPPRVILSDTGNEASVLLANLNGGEPLVRISFRMVIEGILDSVLLQVIPMNVAKGMAMRVMGTMTGEQNLVPAGAPAGKTETLLQHRQPHLIRHRLHRLRLPGRLRLRCLCRRFRKLIPLLSNRHNSLPLLPPAHQICPITWS